MASSPLERAREYHERTKHHYGRYAASLGYMDWETQPDPFRAYQGAPRVALQQVPLTHSPPYCAGLVAGKVETPALDLRCISQLFQDTLGLTAWKSSGVTRWALRANPSSGNLHPTEGYLLAGAIPHLDDEPGVWHYQPFLHALERRSSVPEASWGELAAQLPEGAFLVALTSIYVRESWKYGERAFRYCQLDVGHALAAVAIAAAGLGRTCRLLEGIGDGRLASWLGVAGQRGPEAEHPDALVLVHPAGAEVPEAVLRGGVLPELPSECARSFEGEPNPLAQSHQPWPAIDGVHTATLKQGPPAELLWERTLAPAHSSAGEDHAAGLRPLIHQRRSAVAMDGRTRLSRESFFDILKGLVPHRASVPFAALPWRPRVHLVLFVHRVDGLPPGRYVLVRHAEALEPLQSALGGNLAWTRPEGCPEELDLYLLEPEDCRGLAADLSCGQAIASDGTFACAMLAEYDEPLETYGAWFYRRLYWECGAIGQLLYLGAEAEGVRGTGIGCFFDDETHRALRLAGHAFQDLYHFTLGGPVEDERLETLPPYGHLGG